jgi:hypothetical protein
MLICYDDEKYWQRAGDVVVKSAMNEAIQLSHELDRKGQYRLAAPLAASNSAKLVRLRDGKRLVTDGPYAETREVLGGFYIVDVDTPEEAIEIAARHSGVHVGTVEVRQMIQLDGLPAEK